jgi:hypothetical protein
MTSDKSVAVEQRLNALITGDGWHSVSLSAGWGSSLKYRYTMDLRSVKLRFSNVSPGTTTDGTTIATLPSGYRPNNNTAVPLSCDVTGGSQSPHLAVSSAGACQVYGIGGAATQVTCQGEIAVDD